MSVSDEEKRSECLVTPQAERSESVAASASTTTPLCNLSRKSSVQHSQQAENASHFTEIFPPISELSAALESKLGFRFRDERWLERALTHRSLQRPGDEKSHYERLEFVGDAVLDLVVAHLLLDQFPAADEGDLSKRRAAVVNTQSLAKLARELGLGAHIRLSRGELLRGGAEKSSILADVMEALCGAIYREAGFDQAFLAIKRLLEKEIEGVSPSDPKTELQELLHAKGLEPPVYTLDQSEGPEHAPTFVSSVQIGGVRCGTGQGSTKKSSQQAAAAAALKHLACSGELPVASDVSDSDS